MYVMIILVTNNNNECYGLFTLPDSDSGYCKMQIFLIGSDSDLDPLIEIY